MLVPDCLVTGFSSADLRAQGGARDPGCKNYRGTRGRRVPTPVPTPLPTRKLTAPPVLPARSPSIAAGKRPRVDFGVEFDASYHLPRVGKGLFFSGVNQDEAMKSFWDITDDRIAWKRTDFDLSRLASYPMDILAGELLSESCRVSTGLGDFSLCHLSVSKYMNLFSCA